MRIHFFGATRTTTGSMYLFEVNGQRVLLECGLFQGQREESIERNRNFPFDPKQLDAVVLSHAHIDHCGNLPNLCRQGYAGNIYCTDAGHKVAQLVRDTVQKSGKIIIPAFSIGRTQQIVYTLNQLTEAGEVPKLPVFVDSPLSVNATEVYRLHPECFNDVVYKFLRERNNPFGMENLTYIRDVSQSMKLNDIKDPAIIISASGMCEAGRVRHHLKNHIGNANNLVLFIGYCAEHTLGAQILSGKNPVNIFGEPQ